MKRRRFLISLSALAALWVPSTGPAQCPFVPDGYFQVAGEAPRGFATIRYIALWGYARERGHERPSGIYLTSGEYFEAPLDGIATGPGGLGWRWHFVTGEVAGVAYEFTGKFTSVCDFADPGVGRKGRVMLAGHIVRREYGAVVAESDVEFLFSATLPSTPKALVP